MQNRNASNSKTPNRQKSRRYSKTAAPFRRRKARVGSNIRISNLLGAMAESFLRSGRSESRACARVQPTTNRDRLA